MAPHGRRPGSAAARTARTAEAQAGSPQGRAPRAPFVLLVVGLLCGGLVTLLLLNTVLAQNSIRESDLRKELQQLSLQKQKQKIENMQLEMPRQVADAADRQGMVPDDSARVITPDGFPGGRVASEDQTPVGQERVPGTDR
ncbi:hypothetical protein [Planomonospora sp. ID82291]|uniref:hypothetical protein n=1 Tax=Planomonospora sp. ID82291 TaxID=2738136 RepID=UPI0018C35259|nr:hypothetical protein [Planomonospora sp. ID82291]MBG0817380.1 septum formation initiator family protein [Planomonospora sp. ID82291]